MSKRVGFFGGRQASRLARSFQRLGDMTGMSFEQIVDAVGRPTTTHRFHGGSLLAGWTAGGVTTQYSITLSFEAGGAFVGIQNELHTKL